MVRAEDDRVALDVNVLLLVKVKTVVLVCVATTRIVVVRESVRVTVITLVLIIVVTMVTTRGVWVDEVLIEGLAVKVHGAVVLLKLGVTTEREDVVMLRAEENEALEIVALPVLVQFSNREKVVLREVDVAGNVPLKDSVQSSRADGVGRTTLEVVLVCGSVQLSKGGEGKEVGAVLPVPVPTDQDQLPVALLPDQ